MTRAISPVVGVVVLVLVTVASVAAVGAAVPGTPAEPPPLTDFRLDADASADRLTVTHAGGETVDVANVRVRVRVEGTALAHQPPVPFFSARGFESGPTGPFNHAGGTTWRAGQRATLTIASTNRPRFDAGDRVRVTVATESGVVAELDTTAI